MASTIMGGNSMLLLGEITPGGQTAGGVCSQAPSGGAHGQFAVIGDGMFRFSAVLVAWPSNR